MTTVLVVALAVAVAVILGLLWRYPLRPYIAGPDERLDRHPPAAGRRCDVCDEPATVRLVAEFDDVEEHELGAGGTAMVADYCPDHAP